MTTTKRAQKVLTETDADPTLPARVKAMFKAAIEGLLRAYEYMSLPKPSHIQAGTSRSLAEAQTPSLSPPICQHDLLGPQRIQMRLP